MSHILPIMDKQIAIKISNLSKKYKLFDNRIDRVKEALHPFKKKYHCDFYALTDINLEIKKGETFGIIGKNGSGKSTLLQLIAGVLAPTTGTIQVNGKISALLELGSGFNPEFTGRDNVYMQGAVQGFSREEINKKFDEILKFADIGNFLDQPYKTYSSGMMMRLAFSVAINIDPDILIVDEALSVGDMRFQMKCIRKMNSFKENNKTILFVSHDPGTVNNFCDRAVWLNDGKAVICGETEAVTKRYFSFMT